MIYLDSETVGLTGPMVLLQYAEDDGDIVLHEIFYEPIERTLEVIEYICAHPGGVCGFNLVFDWFHLTKIYNILRVLYEGGYRGLPPESTIVQIEALNPSTFCLRPVKALDLMLAARRGKYQYVMNRKSIVIRRVPQVIAPEVANVLKEHIDLPEICFAKDPEGYKWRLSQSKDKDTKKELPGLMDISLRFRGSTSLRALAATILDEDKADWPIPKDLKPSELSWLPYGQHGKRPWKLFITRHIGMWHSIKEARYYAWKDVDITRKLHHKGFPEEQGGDTDSELACALGATRWRGFKIDHDRVRDLIPRYEAKAGSAPRAPHAVEQWIKPELSEAEQLIFHDTKKETLESLIAHSPNENVVRKCEEVLAARRARYRLTLCERLLSAPNFHPEFKVIGTKSNRQSGGGEEKTKGGSINPQGIPKDPDIRSAFTFTYENERMDGGDADSYEVSIMESVFPDPNLRKDLMSGKKFHALMGEIWLGLDYEKMMHLKDSKDEIYDDVKAADFAMFYGAEEDKIGEVLGLEPEGVTSGRERFQERYPDLYRQRQELALSFCSMRQPGGIGTEVEWHEPAEYVESVLGFRRYFTLENEICRTLFRFANDPPRSIRDNPQFKNVRVTRRAERGSQSALGAMQSALYAAAFGLQAANMRAACNHVIQSPGGEITKEFQVAFWRRQPIGVHRWTARTYNMHDELIAVTDGSFDTVEVRDEVINHFKKDIPLLKWDWDPMTSWGDK